MLRRVVHLFLVAVLLVCPFVCWQGACSADGPDTQVACCCGSPQPQEHQGPRQEPGEPRQCLCGGAILTAMVDYDGMPGPVVDWLVHTPRQQMIRSFHHLTDSLPDPARSTNGRAVRGLIMSLIC